ncbi:unnamed protein product [Blepharisma stoltei]|uniref:Uncharacterized protein n=1 Tax=Blepharisma stoltei TaxID=1481888 RepID=A0AAU9JB11_9CILI|nr:unnamed protein product [Blepharisma stoltei]
MSGLADASFWNYPASKKTFFHQKLQSGTALLAYGQLNKQKAPDKTSYSMGSSNLRPGSAHCPPQDLIAVCLFTKRS